MLLQELLFLFSCINAASVHKQSQLLQALKSGECDKVAELMADPRLDPAADDNQALFLAFASPNTSPECLQALLSNKWVHPSTYSNMAIKHTLVTGRDDLTRVLLSDSRFDPTELNLNGRFIGDGLNLLSQVLPQNEASDRHIDLCKQENGLDALIDIEHDLSNDHVNLLLVAAAANGRLKTVEYLLSSQNLDPSYLNYMAMRFAAAYGHFNIAHVLYHRSGISQEHYSSLLYSVYEQSYRDCWASRPEAAYSERSFALLRWLFTERAMNVSPACHRMRTHFQYEIKLNDLNPMKHVANRINRLTDYVRHNRIIPSGANYLLQYYSTPFPGFYRHLITIAKDNDGSLKNGMKTFQDLLKHIALPLTLKSYEETDPKKAVHRLFTYKYERMQSADHAPEALAEYARARTHKGRYYQQRSTAEAASNQTKESLVPRFRKQANGALAIEGLQHRTRQSAEYWNGKERELLDQFGSWLVSFEPDFSRFSFGTERLSLRIDQIMAATQNQKSKKAAQMAFLKAHRNHVYSYFSQDWKRVHGFDRVSEAGESATVTVIDGFPGSKLPSSLQPAILTFSSFKGPSGPAYDHGIAVSTLISHPQLGVSSHIGLHLADLRSISDLEPDLPEHISSVAELNDIISRSNVLIDIGPIGDVVNASFGPNSQKLWAHRYDTKDQSLALKLEALIRTYDTVLVYAAGNSGSKMSIGNYEAKLLASSPSTSHLFINVVGLLDDGLHLSPFTEQPAGSRALQTRTLCAIGSNLKVLGNDVDDRIEEKSGTSFSAPIISGAAALLISHLRKTTSLTSNEIRILAARVLLESAEPIVLIETTEAERHRMGALLEYETPAVLEGIYSRDLRPGEYTVNVAGEKRNVQVAAAMIRDSRSRYGMGRLDVPAAFKLVSLMLGRPSQLIPLQNPSQ